MVIACLLGFLLSGFVSLEQEISVVEIKIKGNFMNVEVSDFPYEGVLTVDIKGTIKDGLSAVDYPNSFVKNVEVKKSKGFTRIIFRMVGPFEIRDKSTSSTSISISLKPLRQRIVVEPMKYSKTQAQPSGEVKVVKETVFVSEPKPVYLRCRDLIGEELSEFVKIATGRSLDLKKDKRFTGEYNSVSLERFFREFPDYFEKYAK
ncbi:MAG: hypothetical protein ABIM45_03750 [candidate division WOR-3 bacterium]